MTRHPTARRVHRAETAPDDAFVARILELSAWAKANARRLVTTGVILVLGGVAALYYQNYRGAVREQAATRLAEVRQTAASGNTALAIRDLEAFLARFGGTAAAAEARVLLAQLQLQDGKPDQAIATLEAASPDAAEPLGVSAVFLLAAAYEASGREQDAERLYLRVADEAEFDSQRREALDAAGRLRMTRGDAAGAASLYERLVRMTEDVPAQRGVYEMRLAEAQARARAGSAGG